MNFNLKKLSLAYCYFNLKTQNYLFFVRNMLDLVEFESSLCFNVRKECWVFADRCLPRLKVRVNFSQWKCWQNFFISKIVRTIFFEGCLWLHCFCSLYPIMLFLLIIMLSLLILDSKPFHRQTWILATVSLHVFSKKKKVVLLH